MAELPTGNTSINAKGRNALSVTDRKSRRSSAVSRKTSRFSVVEDVLVKRCMTKRQRGIVVTMTLFATITSAQFFAAFAAHSLALLGDCASMAVDTLSYGANLWAECVDSKNRMRNQLIASFVSIIVLLSITGYVIYESISVLTEDDGGDDDDDVNQYIVFAFALAGLLFDLAGIAALWMGHKEAGDEAADLNLYSAGMHVFADCLRSGTTLVESILIWFWKFDGARTDAISALAVSGLIILPCLGMIKVWVSEVIEYCGTSEYADDGMVYYSLPDEDVKGLKAGAQAPATSMQPPPAAEETVPSV